MTRRPLPLLASLATVLAVLLGAGAVSPSSAAPKPKPQQPAAPAQVVGVRVLPQLAAPGAAPEPAAAALNTITGTFSPAVPGRAAYLQVLDGKKWVGAAGC